MSGEVNSERWSRLPVAWIVEGRLVEFRAGRELGTSMAALKLLTSIVLLAKNAPVRVAGPDQGSVMLSYDELMGLTHLSRASVAAGVKRLEAMGLVTVPGATTAKGFCPASPKFIASVSCFSSQPHTWCAKIGMRAFGRNCGPTKI